MQRFWFCQILFSKQGTLPRTTILLYCQKYNLRPTKKYLISLRHLLRIAKISIRKPISLFMPVFDSPFTFVTLVIIEPDLVHAWNITTQLCHLAYYLNSMYHARRYSFYIISWNDFQPIDVLLVLKIAFMTTHVWCQVRKAVSFLVKI